MDQIKIGKFISLCRKKKNLTQIELAEKLNITDRAISKWENGRTMPDSGLMLDLCSILGISVNELLSGEKIKMEKYNEKTEEILLEMAKKEEQNNKKLMVAMYSIVIISIIFYMMIIIVAGYLIKEGPTQLLIIAISTITVLIALLIALKFEVDAGYYECKGCHHKFVPTYKEVFLSMHMGTTRYLKCPKCKKHSWSKKVINK